VAGTVGIIECVSEVVRTTRRRVADIQKHIQAFESVSVLSMASSVCPVATIAHRCAVFYYGER